VKHSDEPASLGEALSALACLLPALVCAWPGPGALLRDDPWPQLAGAGLELLTAIPALVLLVARGKFPGVRLLTLYLVPLLVAVGWISLGSPSDTLEASRALFVALAGLALLLAGAALGPAGRRILARGLVVVALLLLVPALCDGERGYTGALGNTGSVSQCALPGAAAGALLFVSCSGAWRFAGAAALAAFVVYAGRVPVLTGAAVLACVLLVAALRARDLRLCAGAALALLAFAHPWRAPQAPSPAPAPSRGVAAAGDTGGLAVREKILARTLRLARANLLFGVGPGQFAAAFPPYRDPEEIEISSHQRRLDTESEVEHPHDDWILPLVEGGLVAGLCWIAFLGAAAWTALRRLAEPEPLAAAALAVLANAAAHGVLSFDAVSSSLGFACLGALLARERAPLAGWTRRFLPLAALALCLVQIPRALALVRHGQALSDLGTLDLASGSLESAVDRALAAAPDSVAARSLRARFAPAAQRDPALARSLWEQVLALRPNRFEAWMQLGTLAARAGKREEALSDFTQAAALDPCHPGLLQNMVTLFAELGQTALALSALEELQATHPQPAPWIAERGARAWLAGREATARALFEKSGVFALPEVPGQCFAEARARRQKGEQLFADCLESAAQRGFAREHAAALAWADAARNYRQELHVSSGYEPQGARPVRLELAAALVQDGRLDEARGLLAELAPRKAELAALPEWARGVLDPLLETPLR
jgi:tetratricopeptide (TPR) repeat protein